MGLSGLVGAGAAQGLEQLLAEQLEREMFAEQQRRAQMQEALQTRGLDQSAARDARGAEEFDQTMDFNRERATAADTRASEEMQQSGIQDMREQQERQRVNLTRLQGEEDVEQATSDPSLAPLKKVALLRRGGVNVGVNDVLTPEQRQAELDAETDADIRRDRARQAAEFEFSERRGAGTSAGSVASQKWSAEQAEAVDTAREAARLAAMLRQHPGMPQAFGVWDSKIPTLRQNTADAEEIRDSLSSLLTLENTGKLKGVLSNTDMAILRQASTTLNGRLGDESARRELDRIVEVMHNAVARAEAGGAATAPAVSHEAPGATGGSAYERYRQRRPR